MLARQTRGVGRAGSWGVGRSVPWLAAVALLAGCANSSAGSAPGAATPAATGAASNGAGAEVSSGGSATSGTDGSSGLGSQVDGGAGSAALGGGATGWGSLAGSGRLASRTLDLSGVSSVTVGASFQVRLMVGQPARATVWMDDNLTDRVEASVVGDELRLDLKPGESVRNASLSAQLMVGRLERLAAGGASRVELAAPVSSPALHLTVAGASAVSGPITAGQLWADVSGASTLALSGRVQDLQLSATGTGRMPLSQLTAQRLDADLSGVSRASVTVSDRLAARTSGVSVLEYRGSPAFTRAQATGLSSIRHDFDE